MADTNGDAPSLLEGARALLRRPLDRAYRDAQAARYEALATEAANRTLENVVRRVEPDDDGFVPISLGSDGVRDLDEHDAMELREQARKADLKSPLVIGYRRTLLRFVMGEGPEFEPPEDVPEQVADRMREWWDEFRRVNDWDDLEDEIAHRTWRDGESFIRKFVHEGSPPELSAKHKRRLRRIDPEFKPVRERDVPEGMVVLRMLAPEHIRDPKGEITHGIATDRDDVQTVLAYIWSPSESDASAEVLGTDEVHHIKIRTDNDIKRGRSVYEPILKRNKQYEDWLEYRIILNLMRTAVVLNRKVEGNPSQVSSIRDAQTDRYGTNSANRKLRAFKKGTVITSSGIDYEFASPNLQASDAQKDGRAIQLNMAAATGIPEFMFTGDASNANFASTLVAESPAIKEFESWQDFFTPHFSRIWRWVMVEGAAAGQIEGLNPEQAAELEPSIQWPEMHVRQELDHAKANAIRHQNGVLSKEGWARDEGIDWDMEKDRLEQERQESIEFTAPPEMAADDEEGAGDGDEE